MRKLFVCNTYYQLIMASHLALSLFSNDECDIVITDQSNNAKVVYERLTYCDKVPFSSCFYVETKYYCSKKKLLGFFCDVYNSLTNIDLFGILGQNVYDEILIYNYDFAVFSLFNRIKKQKKDVIITKYEEGVLGYNHIFDYPRLKVIKFARKVALKGNLEVEKFYCFFPEFYKWNIPTVEIPPIQNDRNLLSKLLADCFNIKVKKDEYGYQYIFFTSVYDFEGGKPVGEFEVINKIAKKVGKENILIKKHPRDSRLIYEENGFAVDGNSYIPWEALQFNIDLTGKTLLTVNSGAVISTGLLFGSDVRSFYVYPLCDLSENLLARESIHEIDSLLSCEFIVKRAPNVRVLEDIEEL